MQAQRTAHRVTRRALTTARPAIEAPKEITITPDMMMAGARRNDG
jgi:hypothetical protein